MKKRILTIVLLIAALFTALNVQAQAPVDSPEKAIEGLLTRIGGDGAANKFEIVIDANLAENGKDVFVITSQNGKPCIKGNTQLSVATGINWYLNHYAHINLTWNNLTTDLSKVTLPVPTTEEKHISSAAYRYDFNTCTFSYSMAFWTWERWQQEIDWMALHGINAPLNLVGLDVVTRKFLRELGVSENDINDYIAGPGFIAWFAMNNLEGWGGTINSPSTGVDMSGNPDWWYTRQENLCRNMLQRMRELGMQPVIPGFSGQVPNCITKYTINGFSSGDVVNNGTWAGGYTRPDILKPNTTSYQTFATVYYKHLHEVMGVSELYSIDPFHEGSLPSGVTNKTCYPNIMVELDNYYNGVSQEDKTKNNVDEQPKWIIQYWQGVPQSGAFTAMKDAGYTNRFIGLDLFADNIYADNAAKWRTNYYDTCPYIYCMLHNFGGRSGLHGRLETTMDGYFQALAKNNNCQGIGATPEGTETNPILYDMLFELPWMSSNPGADAWLAEYAHSRYGVDSKTAPAALEALKNLKKSVWDCRVNQQGTSEAVILARPNWTINSVSSWSTSAIYWDTQDVLLAADQLYSVKDLVTANGGQDGIANYNYDFIDVVRQAMVDYAAQLLPLINAARGNNAEYTRLYQLYLQLMLDLDTMLSYDENFKLERWTSLARNIADEVAGTTENDRNWLEWNARTQVTVWSKGNTDLHDYSNRCWAGLIKDFHYKRWRHFFENNGNAPTGGWFSGFEYPWTVDFNETYNLAGDYSKIVIPSDMTATEKAAQTFGNYFGRVKGNTKNYIFPMGVATNATKSDVIPEVNRGQEVELPLIIGKEVTISSVWIDLNNDGNAGNGETLTANGNNVTIPADAVIGKTTAKVTYSDGTVITFNIALVENITKDRTVTANAEANGTVAIEGTDKLSITNKEAVKITATANTGYNFSHWTNGEGEKISNDNPYIYYGKEDATFTANFIQDKWGVVACNGTLSGDIASYGQFIHNLSFAYYNREAETILETTDAPTEIFNTIPQIINVPQGASFDVKYNNGNKDGLKYCYFRAFIDLNADGDFDDEGELLKEVGSNGAQNTAVCSNEINVILPYDAPLGITHMRLRFDGAWDNNNKPANNGAKAASIRPVYEIIINITEKSDKAANITVKSNNNDWGTAEVWTDETPDGSTGTEWNVSANIPMYLRAKKTSEDVEFLGWYDQYGRLVTMNPEHTMYAREDATYTAKFRKLLEIDGWQIEYRTDGKNVILTKINETGKNDLIIPENVEILGEQHTVIGFENNLFNNNKELWSITLPNTMEFLGNNVIFESSLKGENTPVNNSDNSPSKLTQVIDLKGLVLKNSEHWKIEIKYSSDGVSSYNQWGSFLLCPGSTWGGAELLYLTTAKQDSQGWHLRSPASGLGDNYFKEHTIGKVSNFTVTFENKGNGKAVIAVTNSEGAIQTSTEFNFTIDNISAFCARIPKGLDITSFKIMDKEVVNPFSGCRNLDKIAIDGDCKNYYVAQDGGLYNSSDVLVCMPEGKEKGADSRALAALIEEMETLTSLVATYNPVGKANTALALTTTQGRDFYVSTNADQNTGGGSNDGGGIAALVDNNESTYFHTRWGGTVVNEPHYIQVDLGAANLMDYFKFTYKPRNGSPAPKAMIVYGSNDGVNFTDVLATIDSNLPAHNSGNTYESAAIDSKRYRYLRFTVTGSVGPGNAQYGGQYFFGMLEFDLYELTSTADVYSYLEAGITNEQAATGYDAMLDAQAVYDFGTTAAEMQAAKTELQSAYDTLKALLEAAIPVKLTTDEENPVLYKVIIKRANDGSKVLGYDEPTGMVAVQGKADNNSWQAWYFMGSTKGVTIHPYNADGKVLSADDTGNSPAKVWATEKGEKAFYEWKFVSRADGYYNIRAHDNSNYFSNNGGTTNKMGFWNDKPDTDGGSLFKFIDAEFDNNNPRFYQLSDFKATTTIDGTNIYGGTSVGLYTGGKEYREAYTAAKELIEAGNTSNSEACHDTYKALRMASNNLSYNIADSDKFYVIKSTASNNYCKGKYVHTYSKPHIHTNAQWGDKSYDHRHLLYKEIDDVELFPLAVFQFEETGTVGEYKMKNLHTGLYVKSFGKDAEHLDKDTAAVIKIQGIADGQVILQIENNAPMHAQQDFNTIVAWRAEANNASTWSIEEVKTPTEIVHPVEFTDAKHQTLYLNYDVEIPNGVEAYIATGYKDEWLYLDEIEETIPARTAVILKAPKGNYTFKYSENDVEQLDNNILQGTLWEQIITKDNENSYYVLAYKDNTVGMYNPVNGNNEGEFKNNANKAYLQISSTNIPSFAFFGFRDDEGATAINEVNDEDENIKAIYDLTGRKIETPNKGIYIINGKKVFVK